MPKCQSCPHTPADEDRFCPRCGAPVPPAPCEGPLRGFFFGGPLICDQECIPDWLKASWKRGVERSNAMLQLKRAKVLEELELPYRIVVMKTVEYVLKNGEQKFTFHNARLETDEPVMVALLGCAILNTPSVARKSGWIRDEDLHRWDHEQALQWARNMKANIEKYKP